MIRPICLNIFIAIYSFFIFLSAVLLSFFDKGGRRTRFYLGVPWAKVILWVCGIHVRVSGQEHVNPDVPTVFMCNHQSYFDIFAILAYLPSDFKFIMKQELMKIPLMGLAMRRAGHIGIRREDLREAISSLDLVADRIKSGTSVLVYPEGTRSADGKLQPFKKGGFHLAVKSGCDILPVAISNSHRIAAKGSLKINRGSFDIHFGKPISVTGYGKDNLPELIERVRSSILSHT